MKIINQPIKVMAIFYTDGKIEPVKFRLDEQVIYVEKVIKTYEDNALINNHIFFVCQTGTDIYELKYELKTKIWYLFKK